MTDNETAARESTLQADADELMAKVLKSDMTDAELERAVRKLDLFSRFRRSGS